MPSLHLLREPDGLLVPAQPPDSQANQGVDKQQDTDPLRGGQPEQEAADFITAQKFQNEPHHRINQHVDINQLVLHQRLAEQQENQHENQQVAGCLHQLHRKAVDVVDAGIDGIAVNGKAKMRLNAVAAAAEKAADSAEHMEQRHEHRVKVKEVAGIEAFVEVAVYRDRDKTADKAAVEHHAADAVENDIPEFFKPQTADILERLNQQIKVGERVNDMRAEENSGAENQHGQHKVKHVDAEAFFGEPCAEKSARQSAEHDHDAVGAELSAEQFKRRKHTYPHYTKIQPAKG